MQVTHRGHAMPGEMEANEIQERGRAVAPGLWIKRFSPASKRLPGRVLI